MLNKPQKSSMEKEIYEQVGILSNLFYTHVSEGDKIKFEIPYDVNKIVFVASGSSYHCARYGADLFGNVAGMEARAIYSSEFLLKINIFPFNKPVYIIYLSKTFDIIFIEKVLLINLAFFKYCLLYPNVKLFISLILL